MNGVDILILAVFFISVLIGAARGFTKEILSLFNWGGATALSYIFLPLAQSVVEPYIANPLMANGIAFFCEFILFLIILSIIANIISGYIHESSFRGIDHSLGFGFGILRGVVFISAAELLFSTFSPRQTQSAAIQEARFIPMARKGGDTLLQVLPASARAWILEQATKVEHSKLREHLKNGVPNVLPEGTPGAGAGKALEDLLKVGEQGNAPGKGINPTASPGVSPGASQGANPGGGTFSFQMGPPQQAEQAQPQGAVVVYPPQAVPAAGPSPIENPPPALGQPVRNAQATVDELSQLRPQSSPKEDAGYTSAQRADMNRLFQTADGQ
jgi:membrane protein required for colicin V production